MKYYLHDSNSFNDEKITELFISFGYEGLGLFYTILEKLAQQEKPIKTNVLKAQLKVGKRLQKCWDFMESIELISSNNGETFNEQLLNFSGKYVIKKENNRKRIAEWRKNQELTENVTCYESVRNADKVNKSKVNRSKVKEIDSEKSKRFSQPTLLEVEDYCFERKNTVDASKFIDYYTSNGWRVGKNSMKDWRAAVRTWEKTQNNNNNGNKQQNGFDENAKWRAEMEASIARDYAALHE